jgi:protein-S-isoprenylcysteine O-methyltransferase Ste14
MKRQAKDALCIDGNARLKKLHHAPIDQCRYLCHIAPPELRHPPPDRKRATVNRNVLGAVLVALQFALMASEALLAMPVVTAGRTPVAALCMVALGALLGLWALTCNRPGNFNIRPLPRDGAELVQTGPYRLIRHPMYSAVILCTGGGAWIADSPLGWSCLAGLCLVLMVKARFEEQWMLVEHPGYGEYRNRTWRFIPGVY